MSNVFKLNGFKIMIEVNKKIVYFLDVIFDFMSGIYKLFMKFNNKLFYVYW